MQECGTFLGFERRESPLWGEGGPMSPQEAMACGTVPVCFDINGPWELIQQRYNGVIVAEFTPDAIGSRLIGITRNRTSGRRWAAGSLENERDQAAACGHAGRMSPRSWIFHDEGP